MSKTVRVLGTIALACGALPLVGVAPAFADTAAYPASSQGYFNASGIVTPNGVPQPIPNAPAAADGVAVGNLAVAAKAGGEDKVSALLYDLSAIDPASIVTKAILTVPLATGDGNVTSPNAAPAKVVACMAGETGFGGEDGSGIAVAPERLCDAFEVVAKASADGKAYEFDITTLAAGWVAAANDGVMLTSLKTARSEPFQVVFATGSKTSLAVVYTAPPAETVVAPPVDAPVDTAPPVDFGGSGFSGGTAPQPNFDGGFVPAPQVPAPAPAPQAGVAPQAAPAAVSTVASSTPVESLRPDTSFWLALLGFAALLALLSLIMGDSTLPSVRGRQSRLSTALAARQSAAAPTRRPVGRALHV